MPKQVDHRERRREIAGAVARIAAGRGLLGVTFREVAAEAGISVSLVQHYFGSKEGLLIGTLDIESDALGQRICDRVADLGPAPRPLDTLRTVATCFLPDDEASRAAMLLYHGFSAVALTDVRLRDAAAFRNASNLVGFIGDQLTLAHEAGDLAASVTPDLEAQAVLALVLGLSLGVLLDQMDAAHAVTVLDAHLARLSRAGPSLARVP